MKKYFLLFLIILTISCEKMNEADKFLQENLIKESFQKGKITFNIESYYFRYLGAGDPADIGQWNNQFITAIFNQLPTVILLGFNDFLSNYSDSFRYTTSVTHYTQFTGVGTPVAFNKEFNNVITNVSDSFYRLQINALPTYIWAQVQSFPLGYAVNGDVVIIQRGATYGSYMSETVIKCDQMPTVSFIEYASRKNIILESLQLEFYDEQPQVWGQVYPEQKELPIFILKKDLFGMTELDSITPSTFAPAAFYENNIIDIPIYMPLKDISIITSRNYNYNKMRITLFIKTKK